MSLVSLIHYPFHPRPICSPCCRKADLARQRAEFMASLSSNNSTGTDTFWSKLQASEKAASAKAPSSTSSSSYRPVASEEDDQWRPSSVSTVHSDVSTRTPPLGTSVFNRTPPVHGRRSVRGSETPPDTPPSYAMPRNTPGPHLGASFLQVCSPCLPSFGVWGFCSDWHGCLVGLEFKDSHKLCLTSADKVTTKSLALKVTLTLPSQARARPHGHGFGQHELASR